MWSRSRPGLRWSRAIWECPDRRPSSPVFSGKSQTWTGTAGFGPVQTGSQSVWDRTSPTLGGTGVALSAISIATLLEWQLHGQYGREQPIDMASVPIGHIASCNRNVVSEWSGPCCPLPPPCHDPALHMCAE